MKKLLVTFVAFIAFAAPLSALASTQIFSSLSTAMTATSRTIPITAQANTANNLIIMPLTGTFSNLHAYVDQAPGGAASWTVTLQQASVNQAVTCTITGAATSCSDTVNTFGNTIATDMEVTFVAASSPAPATLFFSIQFTPSTPGQTALFGSGSGNTSAYRWNALVNGLSLQTPETNAPQIFATGGTLSNAYAVLGGTPGAGTQYDFYVKQNAATTTLTCTVSGTNSSCNDTTHSVTVTAGDTFDEVTVPTGSPTSRSGGFGTVFTPTTSGDFLLMDSYDGTGIGGTRFSPIGTSNPGLSTVEASTTVYVDAMTIKSMDAYVIAPPGSGKTVTFNLRKNGSTLATCAITGTSATHCTVASPGTTVLGDKIDMQEVPTGGAVLGAATVELVASVPSATVAPTVTTDSAQNLPPTSAKLFGSITATGGVNPTTRGFAISTDSAVSLGVSTSTESGSFSTGAFSFSTTTLAADTLYYYRAWANNSAGTSTGAILSFTMGNTTPQTTRRMRLFTGFTVKIQQGGRLKVQ